MGGREGEGAGAVRSENALAESRVGFDVPPGDILLDTHILLWAVSQPIKLSEDVLRTIRTAGRARQLFVSVMTIWEISLLVSKGRISLPQPTRQWLEVVLTKPGVRLNPVTAGIAIEANELPDGLPGDPVDRLLVATARLEGLAMMTRDREILAFARRGHLKALPA